MLRSALIIAAILLPLALAYAWLALRSKPSETTGEWTRRRIWEERRKRREAAG